MQLTSTRAMTVVVLIGCLALGVLGLQKGEAAPEQTGVVVWVSNLLVKVFKDTPPPQGPTAQEVSTIACRNEYEPAQICVTSSDYERPVRARVSPLTHVSGRYMISTINSRFVGYVPVPQNTPGGRQDLPKDAVIRKAPGLFPDPLIPDKQVELKPGQTQPIWITVKVPTEAKPGVYRGNVEVTTDAGILTVPIQL